MGKRCRECGKEKELKEFYAHSQMKDGHLNKCIDCVKVRVSDHRTRNLEKVHLYDRERGRSEKRLALNRERSRKRSAQYAIYKTAWAKRNRIKVNAALKARRAVQKGDIAKKSCEVCGAVKVQGHHDDYSKPLEVRWLCQKHHKELHRRYKD